MSVATPPHVDGPDPLEALIKEARERQRRRRMLVVGSLVLLAGLAYGIGQAVGGGPPARPSAEGDASPASNARWCQAAATAPWRSLTTRNAVPLPRTEAVWPFAVGSDGRTFFATVHSRHGFSGVARIDAATGATTEIKAFSRGSLRQVGGSFDGRWLVWMTWPGQTEAAVPWTVWAWDSHTGRIRQIGAARRRSGIWDSSWVDVDVRDGVAAWAQGSRGIHLYDLRTQRDVYIHPRHLGWPRLFAGGLVAWSGGAGRHARTYAVSALTGKPMPVPHALHDATNLLAVGTDGHATVFPDGKPRWQHGKSLWWSPSLRRTPQQVLTVRNYHWIDYPLSTGGGYFGFGAEPGLFVGDSQVHRYVKIAQGYGRVLAGPRALVVMRPLGNAKSPYAPMAISFVPLDAMPSMASCAA